MAAAYKASAAGPVFAIAALAAERACLAPAKSSAASLTVVQCGPGAERAAAAARRALEHGAAGLVSWGFCGALAPELVTGNVVLAEHVLASDGRRYAIDAPWRLAAARALADRVAVCGGSLASVARVLETPAEKHALGASTGAIAVDMESAAILAVAQTRGVPCLVVRVVFDAAAEHLPPDAESWVDARGARRLAPLLRVALEPARWPMLWMLGRRFRVAQASLCSLAAALARQGFAFPGAR